MKITCHHPTNMIYSVNFGLLQNHHDNYRGEDTTVTAENPEAVRQILTEKYGWKNILWVNAIPEEKAQENHRKYLAAERQRQESYASALEAIGPKFDAEVVAKDLTGRSKIGSRRALRARLLKEHYALNPQATA